ncbi:hypothetical protein RF11_06825 [Thelohanellus kitauei]|uniref:Uncharacterized protein n=1 Tax=Thelohanellus kitauei TaxID=669202 RepID=A0A0C2JGK7_THEKT|nr:hypothetical protein RF11_06825 [Thelohanellus kitauei]
MCFKTRCQLNIFTHLFLLLLSDSSGAHKTLCGALMPVDTGLSTRDIRCLVNENELEVLKPAPVHFCTDFPSTATATVSTYGRVVLRLGTFLQAVKVVQDSHLLNTHPHPQPTRATLPTRHSFAGKFIYFSAFINGVGAISRRNHIFRVFQVPSIEFVHAFVPWSRNILKQSVIIVNPSRTWVVITDIKVFAVQSRTSIRNSRLLFVNSTPPRTHAPLTGFIYFSAFINGVGAISRRNHIFRVFQVPSIEFVHAFVPWSRNILKQSVIIVNPSRTWVVITDIKVFAVQSRTSIRNSRLLFVNSTPPRTHAPLTGLHSSISTSTPDPPICIFKKSKPVLTVVCYSVL